jgi:type I restriction enzyme M protein
MVKLALVNMYLHGFPEPKIHEYDSLTSEKRWDETFDVILANPPFMSPSGGIVPHKKFSIQSSRAEVLFVDYIAEHLKIGGRAGIIIPEGIIFQSNNAYKNLRKNLVENWGLFAVVSLPSGVFQPYAGVKTSILFLDKEFSKHTEKIVFITVENDGFELGTQRKPIEKNDLPKVFSALREWKDKQKISDEKNVFSVTKKQILDNIDYSFTVDRYKEITNRQNKKWTMITLGELESQGEIEFLRGQGVSKKDIVDNGKNKCIHYGELYTLYSPIIDNVMSNTNIEGKVLSVAGDVLVPSTTTADAMGIAIARALNTDGIILGGDINIIRTRNKSINSKFLSLLLNFPLKRDLASFAKGVNILHISNKDIKQIHIPLIPMKKQLEILEKYNSEQRKITGMKAKIEESEENIKEIIFEVL